MSNATPWEILSTAITNLKDKVNQAPEIREATVAGVNPVSVLFDTDTEPTLVKGSLEGTVVIGARVLTLKLRHYVWIVGNKFNGINGVTNWDNATSPGFYWSEAAALNNPVGNIAVGIVTAKPTGANPRIMQTLYFPSETAAARKREYRRVLNMVTGVWSPWAVMNEDTGRITSGVLVAATGWAITSQEFRAIGDQVWCYFVFQRNGGTITTGAVGDIGNSSIGTLATGWTAPTSTVGVFSPASTGRLCAVSFAGGGTSLSLTAVSPGADIVNNESFSVTGTYLRG